MGVAGRLRQAIEGRNDRRQSVQFLDSRNDGDGGGGGGGSFVPAGAVAVERGADFPSQPADDDIPF